VVSPQGYLEKYIADQARKELQRQPPKTDDDGTLAYFYYKKGNAAMQSARYCEGLPDLRKALYHAEKTGMVSDFLLRDLGRSEMECSNVRHGIELLERGAKKTSDYNGAHLLVPAYLAVGDIESATRAKNVVLTYRFNTASRARSTLSGDYRQLEPDRRFIPAMVQYLILNAQGKYREAEYYIRECLQEKTNKLVFDSHYEVLTAKNDLAFNLSMQERFSEAEVEVREAIEESIGMAGKPGNVTADAVGVLANIMLRQGRFEEAEQLENSRIKILDSIGVSTVLQIWFSYLC